jgi:hypothetical protein
VLAGAGCHGGGGDQKCEPTENYRKCGQALQVSHPFVAARLLMDSPRPTITRRPAKTRSHRSGADFKLFSSSGASAFLLVQDLLEFLPT